MMYEKTIRASSMYMNKYSCICSYSGQIFDFSFFPLPSFAAIYGTSKALSSQKIMAETHCFIGTREVGKPKLRTTSSGASTASSVASTSRKSPQRISDILRLRRLRLNRAKTTASNSLSDRYDDYSNRQRIEKGNLINFYQFESLRFISCYSYILMISLDHQNNMADYLILY